MDLSITPPDQLEEILNGPALVPPPDVVPNFETPSNKNDLALFIQVICLISATLFFAMRIFVRFIILKTFRIEDGKPCLLCQFALVLAFVDRVL